jgi:hypothetical protein
LSTPQGSIDNLTPSIDNLKPAERQLVDTAPVSTQLAFDATRPQTVDPTHASAMQAAFQKAGVQPSNFAQLSDNELDQARRLTRSEETRAGIIEEQQRRASTNEQTQTTSDLSVLPDGGLAAGAVTPRPAGVSDPQGAVPAAVYGSPSVSEQQAVAQGTGEVDGAQSALGEPSQPAAGVLVQGESQGNAISSGVQPSTGLVSPLPETAGSTARIAGRPVTEIDDATLQKFARSSELGNGRATAIAELERRSLPATPTNTERSESGRPGDVAAPRLLPREDVPTSGARPDSGYVGISGAQPEDFSDASDPVEASPEVVDLDDTDGDFDGSEPTFVGLTAEGLAVYRGTGGLSFTYDRATRAMTPIDPSTGDVAPVIADPKRPVWARETLSEMTLGEEEPAIEGQATRVDEEQIERFLTGSERATTQPGQAAPAEVADIRYSRVSTRVPTAVKATENPLGRDKLVVGLESSMADPDAFAKNVEVITQYPNYQPDASARTPAQRAERFIQHVVDNLLWLYDQTPVAIRNRSKLWYDGANKIATRWASKYGTDKKTIAGVMAVLSPQKDWFQNVSLAERVLDIMNQQQDTRWTYEMTATANEIFAGPQYQEDLGEISGTTLSELSEPYLKAIWIRIYDETYNPRHYRVITPEGQFSSFATNKGGERSNVGWGSLNEIRKAVSIIENGSLKNISQMLGDQHKVRNFYNNIVDPRSKHGDVTIDTHAVAAALLRPLAGASTEVSHNFGGGGASSSSIFGAKGTYGIYAEAYRRAASARGVLPREMQSITWEAVRGLFDPAYKRDKRAISGADQIWQDFKRRKADVEQTRARILQAAGGITDPDWARSNPGANEKAASSTYAGDVSEHSVSGRTAEPATRGDRSDAAGGADRVKSFRAPAGWDTVDTAEGAPRDKGAVREALRKLAKRIAPRANLELPDTITAVINGETVEMGGLHNAAKQLIQVSLDSGRDPAFTLRHEAVHHLKAMGLFTDQEWSALERMAKLKWRQQFDIDSRYDFLSEEEKLNEEAIADAYGSYKAGEKVPAGIVQRALDKISTFVQRLGNLLKGYGFQTADDIFERVESGEVGQREKQATPKSEIKHSVSAHKASWDSPEPTKIDNVIRTLQDKHIDTRRVIQAITKKSGQIKDALNVYLQEELFHGRSAKRVQDFIDGELKPLLQDMASRGVTMKDFEGYLHARHAPERNAQVAKVNPNMPDGGSGMTNKEAADYMQKLPAAKKKDFDALAQKIDAITDGTRQLIVGYGLESQDAVNAWGKAYKHYVPLMRDESAPGVGQGISVKGPASKRAMGSKREVVDIIANIAMQRERAIARGEKNRVANALVGLAQANPNEDWWTVDQPPKIQFIDPRSGLVSETVDPLFKSRDNVVMARSPGPNGGIVEHAVIFNEDNERALQMAQSLKNLDVDELGMVLSASAKITRYFAAINTQYNPVFGVVNIVRDTQGALFNLTTTPIAGKQAEVMKNTLSALRGIYIDLRDSRSGQATSSAWAQLWEEFQKEGGQTGYRDMFRTSKDRAESIERELKRISEGKAKQFGRAVFDWLSDYNTTLENAVRLAAYRVGKESGLTNQQAASVAKNLTVNFNRRGQIGMQAGALYAFFNASVQGSARLIETLNGPAGKKIILGGLGLGVMQAVILAAAGFDDNEPPEFIRERNLVIPFGDGKYVTVPMPLGLHLLPNLGRIPTEYVLSGFRAPGKRIAQMLGMFADAFNPVGNAGWSIQTITPTVVDPLAALAENKDFTGKPIARKDFGMNETPGHTRAKDTATTFSKTVSKSLNWLTGGTNYKPGTFSPTPDQIDYLIGQLTGGVGRELSKLEQTVAAQFTGEDLPTHKVPLLGRFYGTTDQPSAQANRFYENLKEINQHELEIKGRRKAGEPIGDYFKENPEARLFTMANGVERQVSQLRKSKRALMDKDASTEQIKAVERQIEERQRRFNETVRRAKEAVQQ